MISAPSLAFSVAAGVVCAALVAAKPRAETIGERRQTSQYESTLCDGSSTERTDSDRIARELCVARARVAGYFGRIGYAIAARFSVQFVDDRTARVDSQAPHGWLDLTNSTIGISRSSDRRAWGLEWNAEIEESIIAHEITHLYIVTLLGDDQYRIARAWHELLAYAIQFEVMDAGLRQAILARYPDADAVTWLTEINEFTYGADPERFSVVAYRTYIAQGGAAFVRRTLSFEFWQSRPDWYKRPR